MPTGNKLYFASDFHLGVRGAETSAVREARIIRWLDMVKVDAAELFLVGDVFDFWFEYKTVVPRGYIRFLGKLAELADAGIKLYFFKGNHDMWMFDYFEKELNATIITNELEMERNGKTFYLHHGDGLGPGDKKYKFLKKIFRSRLCQWMFARLHPNLGIGLANAWSHDSKQTNARIGEAKLHPQEWIQVYSRELLQSKHYDYMVYGHRHKPLDIALTERSRYVNLGDWLYNSSYAVFDGTELTLKYFEREAIPVWKH
ncbi:UDP-2,3-diacylglucosamine diphosphatase [Mucilaginibacter psychrotolerans]|uniref:UDP-2,3-diacylglucosamine diphosphatase n=1 Tax=Mucilaginibacter psychrotolerans TaxID=1524096 RepID=A0A4Y8SHX4_9SPHI|nr:UDP-2,3-diacylglucosamine diphosphatase [Mucilaginibacter psychrotolerans]TFF38472.1 UDP-2,3-diacylglucosamine diphosphatase [Mucilaginibacter psychrotolerans]